MTFIEEVIKLAADFEAANGFQPARLLIPPNRINDFRRALEAERSLNATYILGMRVEVGAAVPHMQVRAPRLDLQIAKR